MKKLLYLIIPTLLILSCMNKSNTQIVEASCGQCQFNMTDKSGCDLAVRIDNHTYFVDNTSIDDHGDAHAEEGFCNTIRQAKVKGNIVDGRFEVTFFELLDKNIR